MKTHLIFFFVSMISIQGIVGQNFTESQKIVQPNRLYEDNLGGWGAFNGSWSSYGSSHSELSNEIELVGDKMFVGHPTNNRDSNEQSNLSNSGAVLIFERQGGNWVFSQKITHSERSQEDEFGFSIDVNEDFLVVGARGEETDSLGNNPSYDAGAVYVYKNINGTYTLTQKLVSPVRNQGQRFGQCVSFDDSLLVISEPFYSYDENGNNFKSASGVIHVYRLNNSGSWQHQSIVTVQDRHGMDYLGAQLLVKDGLVFAVSQNTQSSVSTPPYNAVKKGAVYVFNDSAGTVSQAQKLTGPHLHNYETFGNALKLTDNELIVGSWTHEKDENGQNTLSRAGAVFVYSRSNSNQFTFNQKLVPSDRTQWDGFGTDFDFFDNRLYVGSVFSKSDMSYSGIGPDNGGAVYVFERDNNGLFQETDKIASSVTSDYDSLGFTVAVDSTGIAIAAINEDEDENENNFIFSAGAIFWFDICDQSADISGASISQQTLCEGETFQINVGQNSQLNQSQTWGLYFGSVQDTLVDSSNTGVFNLVASESGSYFIRGIGGCSQNIAYAEEFEVTVSPTNNVTQNIVACDSAMINGTWYHQSGTVVDSLSNQNGCDSIVTTNLTINNSSAHYDTVSGIDSAFVLGQWVYQTGFVFDTLYGANASGCDSILIREVTIYNAGYLILNPSNEVFGEDGGIDLTVVGGEPPFVFDWDNDGLGDMDDSEDLTNVPAGEYSVIVYDLIGQEMTGTATVESSLGLSDLSKEGISIYPNPIIGEQLNVDSENLIRSIRIMDALGRVRIAEQVNASGNSTIDVSGLENGVYLLEIKTMDGSELIQKIIRSE